ncbi:hypothetical protein ACIQLR_000640 [Photobacterium damselae]
MGLEQQISSLVQASENLTGAVNNKIGEIDKKVNEAVRAIPELHKIFFIDSVNGVDTNVGTSKAESLRTIKEAVNRTPLNGSVTIYLKRNQEHFMTGGEREFILADNKTLVFRASDSGDSPIIKMATGVGDGKSICYGLSVGTKATIIVVGCVIDTMTLSDNTAASWSGYGGFVSRGSSSSQVGTIEVILSQCVVLLRDHQLSAHYNRVDYSILSTTISHVGKFTSLVGTDVNHLTYYISLNGLTITDSSKKIKDLFAGINMNNSLINFSLE